MYVSYFTRKQINGVFLQSIKVRHSNGLTDLQARQPLGLVALQIRPETFLNGVLKCMETIKIQEILCAYTFVVSTVMI